jgi:hypothetical protein
VFESRRARQPTLVRIRGELRLATPQAARSSKSEGGAGALQFSNLSQFLQILRPAESATPHQSASTSVSETAWAADSRGSRVGNTYYFASLFSCAFCSVGTGVGDRPFDQIFGTAWSTSRHAPVEPGLRGERPRTPDTVTGWNRLVRRRLPPPVAVADGLDPASQKSRR